MTEINGVDVSLPQNNNTLSTLAFTFLERPVGSAVTGDTWWRRTGDASRDREKVNQKE